MAKSSTRFRNRKINFRTRIAVRTGTDALGFEEDNALDGGEVEFEEEKDGKNIDTRGVDKDEETEHHLQAVLAASNASVSNTRLSLPTLAIGSPSTIPSNLNLNGTRNGGVSSSTSGLLKPPPVPKAFIPTPESSGTIDPDLFKSLYPPNSYSDPVSYIRFSDTVEEATLGAVAYTMDDDDEEWLEAYNASFSSSSKGGLLSFSMSSPPVLKSENGALTDMNLNGRSARDRKGKGEKGKLLAAGGGDDLKASPVKESTPLGPISEDDFEEVMELFERIADEKAPMAHVNLATLPTLSEIEPEFTSPVAKPVLASLKPLAKTLYPYWRERRTTRHGKAIIPQLDYDESNENNPYVCFRRRELKTARKTRRSDQQNLERLVRLRNDLHAAHALMMKTRDRERLKLEAIQIERKIFLSRCEMRDVKRRLGEAEGDEEVLVGRREKKRRRDDPSGNNAPSGGSSSLRLSLRKPDPTNAFSPASLTTSVEELKIRKERAIALNLRMERDFQKKREADQSWEDWTDGAYLARMPPTPARYWRTVETVPGSNHFNGPQGKCEALGFATTYQPAVGHVRTSFRRRVGRGGRVMLDRIAPGMGRRQHRTIPIPTSTFSDHSDLDEEDGEDDDASYMRARRAERFRYDQDVMLDFPSAGEPTLLDDFELRYMVKRASLLRPADVESLYIDGSYLEEAYRWASIEPDRHVVPPVVFGRPPPRPAMPPAQAGGPGGVPIQMQMMAAATQAHRVAQQQAQLKRQTQQGGSPVFQQQQQQRNGSQQGTPVQQGQSLPMQIPMPMQMPMNGTPVPVQQPNGTWTITTPKGTEIPLAPNFQLHLQQQLPNGLQLPPQRLPNGLVASLPNGANGQPATSRLSSASFPGGVGQQMSPPSPMVAAMQQQQLQLQQQQLQQQQQSHDQLQQQHQSQSPSSRPASAQSSHTSPLLQNQGLISGSPGLRQAQLNAAQRKSVTPIMHPMQPGPQIHNVQLPYGSYVAG